MMPPAIALIIRERIGETMLGTLNEQNVRELITYIADRIIENKAYLTEVDLSLIHI